MGPEIIGTDERTIFGVDESFVPVLLCYTYCEQLVSASERNQLTIPDLDHMGKDGRAVVRDEVLERIRRIDTRGV